MPKKKPTKSFNDAFALLKTFSPISKAEEEITTRAKQTTQPPSGQDHDRRLFEQAMQGVMPFGVTSQQDRRGVTPRPADSTAHHKPDSPQQTNPSLKQQVQERNTFLKAVQGLTITTQFKDHIPEQHDRVLSGNRLKQVQRGIISLERQLDLHGLTRDDALQALEQFVRSAQRLGTKAVLIITGKGKHSSQGPVLQQAVAAWLRGGGGHALVNEFYPAPLEFGGDGAFVIFLRPLDKSTPQSL